MLRLIRQTTIHALDFLNKKKHKLHKYLSQTTRHRLTDGRKKTTTTCGSLMTYLIYVTSEGEYSYKKKLAVG